MRTNFARKTCVIGDRDAVRNSNRLSTKQLVEWMEVDLFNNAKIINVVSICEWCERGKDRCVSSGEESRHPERVHAVVNKI